MIIRRSKLDATIDMINYIEQNKSSKNLSIDQLMSYLEMLTTLRSKILVNSDYTEEEFIITNKVANLLINEEYEELEKLNVKIEEL